MLGGQEKCCGVAHDTSALPGGINSAVSVAICLSLWWNLAGMPLLLQTVLDNVMTYFFDSMDWFIIISLLSLFLGYYLDVDGLLAGFSRGTLPTIV
jgi:hypothetical protein